MAVPPPGRSKRTPRDRLSVLSVKSCVTSGVTSKPTTKAVSYLGRMVWFRNSMADSCSNLNRSRTELLASTRSPTWSGRSVWLRKSFTSSAGLESSMTLKSSFLRSFTYRPCLSVTVKTTFTSLTVLRIVATDSSSEVDDCCPLAAVVLGLSFGAAGGEVVWRAALAVLWAATETGAGLVCANAATLHRATASRVRNSRKLIDFIISASLTRQDDRKAHCVLEVNV